VPLELATEVLATVPPPLPWLESIALGSELEQAPKS
jgi:hypothetical protein